MTIFDKALERRKTEPESNKKSIDDKCDER